MAHPLWGHRFGEANSNQLSTTDASRRFTSIIPSQCLMGNSSVSYPTLCHLGLRSVGHGDLLRWPSGRAMGTQEATVRRSQKECSWRNVAAYSWATTSYGGDLPAVAQVLDRPVNADQRRFGLAVGNAGLIREEITHHPPWGVALNVIAFELWGCRKVWP